MPTRAKRSYVSEQRAQAAEATRARVLHASKALFGRRGIDRVTIAEVAAKADVATSTVYALFRSKEGILRELMRAALFGPHFEAARERLANETDPVRLIALSAAVARAIYEAEAAELGSIRGVSSFSPALRKLEQEFERIRLEMQEERLRSLHAQGKALPGLALDDARRILWMYTSRDVYRMMVSDGGWSPARYEEWLGETLVNALVHPRHRP